MHGLKYLELRNIKVKTCDFLWIHPRPSPQTTIHVKHPKRSSRAARVQQPAGGDECEGQEHVS